MGAKNARQPIWFHRPDSGLLLFAGLYESWQPKPGEWERTFTIVTTDANDVVSRVHDRMPVILREETVDAWLLPRGEPGALHDLLVPAPESWLIATPVSSRANSVKNDDAAILVETNEVVP